MMASQFMFTYQTLFNIQSSDPNDLRRGRLLLYLLGGTAVAVSLGLILAIIIRDSGSIRDDEILLFSGGLFMLVLIAVVWLITRNYSVSVGATIFALAFSQIVTFDVPAEVVFGRSLFLSAIPIIIASLTLRPWASFVLAAISGITINAIAYVNGLEFNIVSPLAFMLLALIAWLGASSFERALEKLRTINTELDGLVDERTAAARQARDEAIEANLVKTEMLAKVSHELRTPLGAILGYAEMLRAGVYGGTTERQLQTFEKIIDRHNMLASMISDLLNQSHLEFGRVKIESREVAIQEVLENVESSLRSKIEAKGLDLICIVSSDMPKIIHSDIQRLEQIIVNLLTNALKFTEQGEIRLEINLYSPTLLEIVVQDTGIGISSDDLDMIFEAFRQVDGSAARTKDGFGLGLSIVKQLVSLMSGSIQVQSELGVGSRFNVLLPTNNIESTLE